MLAIILPIVLKKKNSYAFKICGTFLNIPKSEDAKFI